MFPEDSGSLPVLKVLPKHHRQDPKKKKNIQSTCCHRGIFFPCRFCPKSITLQCKTHQFTNGGFGRLTQFMYLRIHTEHSHPQPGRTRLQSNESEESGVLDTTVSLVPKMFTGENGLKHALCW